MRLRRTTAVALGVAAICMAGVAAPGPRAAAGFLESSDDAAARRPAPVRWPLPAAPRPDEADALTRALGSGVISHSQYTLYRALAVFDRPAVRARFGPVAAPAPHDATGLLLDLALGFRSLPREDRRLARTLLARPTARRADPSYAGYSAASHYRCSTNLCVHWESGTSNAPPQTDDNGNGLPDQVDSTLAVFDTAWNREVTEMGYRPPRPDFKAPNQNLDIFLADLGADGTYGYCAIEDPSAMEVSPRHASAFCAVDNDFSPSQYPSGTPQQNLQVTAAHEFFHAIQFGYDYMEDRWFMEATATWMEDEVFDGVNDNYQYLAASALAHPDVSLDYVGTPGEPSGLYRYGSWVFFRFLSEWMTSSSDPGIVRDAWVRADSATGAADDYSLEAIQNAIQARSRSFTRAFGDFAAMNYVADSYYEEGGAYLRELGARPPHHAAFTLSTGERSTGTRTVSIDHLASRYAWIEPAPDLPSGTTLDVSFNTPGAVTGPSASAITWPGGDGQARVYPASLDSEGNGRVIVPFAGLNRVMLVMSNGSTRYSCNQGTEWSCRGRPTDQGQTFAYSATLSNEPAGDGSPQPAASDPAPSSPTPTRSPSPQPSGGSTPPASDDDGGLVTGVSDAPDPFSPNGDGTDDRTRITFSVATDALVTVKIFDLQGNLVRVVGRDLPTPAGYYFVSWNGRNGNGRRVPSATYRYVVKGRAGTGESDRDRGTTTVRR